MASLKTPPIIKYIIYSGLKNFLEKKVLNKIFLFSFNAKTILLDCLTKKFLTIRAK